MKQTVEPEYWEEEEHTVVVIGLQHEPLVVPVTESH